MARLTDFQADPQQPGQPDNLGEAIEGDEQLKKMQRTEDPSPSCSTSVCNLKVCSVMPRLTPPGCGGDRDLTKLVLRIKTHASMPATQLT